MSKATIKEVAKESGVSIATVSRVLNQNGYVSEKIKERVSAAVEKLNYQPNGVARSLKQDKTNTIGVIVPDISNPYFMKISKAIEDTVYPKGYNLSFCSGDENPEKERKLLHLLYEKRVDIIVLATSGGNEELVTKINQSGVPVVLMDRRIDSNEVTLDLVAEDNKKGAYVLTKYLIDQGHTRIGVVNGSLEVSTGIDRYAGYQKAMREHGIQEDSELIFNGSFMQDGGVKAVDYFLNLVKKPTAILSFNNTMTFGVLLELTKREYSIPKDIVVASYGEIEAAKLLKPPGIISVNQSPYAMGLKTGQIILDQLLNNVKGPFYEIFNPILNVSEER